MAKSMEAWYAELDALTEKHPSNLCLKHLAGEGKGYYDGLSDDLKARFAKCVASGLENADSSVGVYAMMPKDYEELAQYFDKVVGEYHTGDPACDKVHESSWDLAGVGDGGVLDVTKLGLGELSMRVRVGRNLAAFPLPGMMTKDDRIKFEMSMLKAFDKIKEKLGGHVYSLTPDFGDAGANPNLIAAEKYDELVKAHVMFKDMDADPYLKSAGIASDWPYGRGCYQSEDKQRIIWFGEEDQLRIMCMKKGALLNEVFDNLNELLQIVESIDGIDFAKSERYGYVTSCPTNLGTGMRASVHIQVPKLTADGTDAKAKAICKPLGLSVRGTGGEHTPIGADGTIDLSPSARLFIKENEIVAKLYQGIQDLMKEENAA